MNKEPVITDTELQAEYAKLDLMRSTRDRNEPLLTEEQFKLLHHARSGDKHVAWVDLCDYFKSRGWGEICVPTLQSRYSKEKHKRGLD